MPENGMLTDADLVMTGTRSTLVDPDNSSSVTHTWEIKDGQLTDGDLIPDGATVVMWKEEPDPQDGMESADDEDTKPLTSLPDSKGVVQRIIDRVRGEDSLVDLLGKEDSGFKAFKDPNGQPRWIAWYSNAFEDKDKEFFPAKAIDAYVARVDMGMVPLPELWIDHLPGAKIGKADWVGRVGLFAMAVGKFDDTPMGAAAAKYFVNSRALRRMSHGFEFDAKQKVDNAFWHYNTFELSILPVGREANPYTSFGGVKAMPIAEWKVKDLIEIFGDETLAKTALEVTETRSKALQERNVAFKEFGDPTADTSTTAVSEQAVKAATTGLKALIPDLLEGQAEILSGQEQIAKQMKALLDANAKLLERVEQAETGIAEIKGDRPRMASTDPETRIKEGTIPVEMKNSMATVDPAAKAVFGSLVSE